MECVHNTRQNRLQLC